MSESPELSNIGTKTPIIRIFLFSRYASIVMAILILADISITFNIPVYRQVMGVLLLLLPGLLFMRLLDLKITDTTEKLLLTLGICVSILLLSGLIFNCVLLNIGIYTPLSTESLLIMLNFLCILFLILQSRNKFSEIKLILPKIRLNRYDKFFLSIAFLIPVLGLWGIYMMNKYSYNTILVAFLIFVSIVILLIVIYNKKFASCIYPILIFSISISLVLLYPMRSDHLLGIDIHSEYYIFQQVMNNLYWQLTPSSGSSSFQLLLPCISISLFPALLQSILHVDAETLYRLYIPILFSVTPVIVYVIANRYLNNIEAFLASIAFISYYSFFSASSLSRATLALLFFALFILVLFNGTFRSVQKSVLLLLFSISMIVTHYSSTFVFLFIIGFSFIISYFLSKKINFKRELMGALILSIIAIAFFWYSMISGGIFSTSLTFTKSVLNLDNMNVEGSHDEMLSQLWGNVTHGYISWINLIVTWLFLFLIGIGVLGLILRSRRDWFESKGRKKDMLLKKEFELEFVIITVLCVAILAMTVILPFLSSGYDLNRIYLQTSIILSVIFIFGGKYASAVIKKITNLLKMANICKNRNIQIDIDKLGYIIILVVLIPHLLFAANIPQQLYGNGDTIIFNSDGLGYDTFYIHDSDISCIAWLDSNQIGNHNIWADKFGAVQIVDQGHIEDCSIITEGLEGIPKTDYIYLRETNIVKNRIYYNYDMIEATGNIVDEYQLNKIFSAPAAILYRSNTITDI